MKRGIFGGTFDPTHLSHVLACHYVLETSDINIIYVVPCLKHPFGKTVTAFEHRLEMCRLAMQRLEPDVQVLDIEGKRGGVSYTIDTVHELRECFPDDELLLIIGSDLLKEMHDWKNFDEIIHIAPLYIIPRLMDESRPELTNPEKFFLPDISSTMVRKKLHNKESIEQYLPQSVIKYIHQHNLYP